jgi:hypothetical protein
MKFKARWEQTSESKMIRTLVSERFQQLVKDQELALEERRKKY